MKSENLLPDIVKIAKVAGDAILEIYQASDDIKVQSKSDDSPLTIADTTANNIICNGLQALSIQFPIISEENKQLAYAQRSNYEYCWMVDPLDGTKEFIKQNGEFTVNIALIHKNRSVLGVVHLPVNNETYWAAHNAGAHFSDGHTEKQLKAPFFTMKETGLTVVCSRSHLNQATQHFVDQLEQPNLLPRGSSLKFMALAAGSAQLYPRLAPTMEWDTAAAQIIVEEAGGSVINVETDRPLEYNKENLLNPHFIAYANRQ